MTTTSESVSRQASGRFTSASPLRALALLAAIVAWIVPAAVAYCAFIRDVKPPPMRRLEVLPGRSIAAVRPPIATVAPVLAKKPDPISIQWLGAIDKSSSGYRRGERCILTLTLPMVISTSCVVTLSCESGAAIDRRVATHCNVTDSVIDLPDFAITEAVYRGSFSSAHWENSANEDLAMDTVTGRISATTSDEDGHVMSTISAKVEPLSLPTLLPRWHPEVSVCNENPDGPRFESTSRFEGTVDEVIGKSRLGVGRSCVYTLSPNAGLGLVAKPDANCKAMVRCESERAYEAVGKCGLNEVSEPVDYVDDRPSGSDGTPKLSVSGSTLTISDNTALGSFRVSIGLDRDPCRPRDME